MKNTLCLFLFSLSLILVSSCKSAKRGSSTVLKDRSAGWLLKKTGQSKVTSEWLDAKARVDFSSNDFSISATAYIRMKKDSAIWLVAKKLGFEGGRVLITTDSVYLIDRINNQFQIKDISFLQKQFNLPMTFFDLQDILLGNAILLPEASRLTTDKDSTRYILTDEGVGDNLAKSYGFNGQQYYLEEMNFSETGQKRTAQLAFQDHRAVDGADFFSYFRTLLFHSQETGTVSMDIKFSKVELNTPKSLTFEIPSHYTKVD